MIDTIYLCVLHTDARPPDTNPPLLSDTEAVAFQLENTERSLQAVSPTFNVTAAGLDVLESHSPAPSADSIERYIRAPQSEEAVPESTIIAAISEPGSHRLSRDSSTSLPRAYSSVGSDRSEGSRNSASSCGSVRSYDSRGSRRGRTTWARIPSNNRLMETSNDMYFCTEPSCMKSFRYQSGWSRHEQAVHHCPYYWVCCLKVPNIMRLPRCFICSKKDILISHFTDCHFQDCATKAQEDRTFLREDQFKQHIGSHLGKDFLIRSIPKDLLSAWKTPNSESSVASLKCGFCGESFHTWSKRIDHVSTHMQEGICKLAWWPDRLPGTNYEWYNG